MWEKLNPYSSTSESGRAATTIIVIAIAIDRAAVGFWLENWASGHKRNDSEDQGDRDFHLEG